MQPGYVYHFTDLPITPETKRDKYIICLSEGNSETSLLFCWVTKRKRHRFPDPGCHYLRHYYTIQKGLTGFTELTYVIFEELYQIPIKQFLKLGMDKIIEREKWELSEAVYRGIANCIKKSQVIEQKLLDMVLIPSVAPKQNTKKTT